MYKVITTSLKRESQLFFKWEICKNLYSLTMKDDNSHLKEHEQKSNWERNL